jgi:hypothetical protein
MVSAHRSRDRGHRSSRLTFLRHGALAVLAVGAVLAGGGSVALAAPRAGTGHDAANQTRAAARHDGGTEATGGIISTVAGGVGGPGPRHQDRAGQQHRPRGPLGPSDVAIAAGHLQRRRRAAAGEPATRHADDAGRDRGSGALRGGWRGRSRLDRRGRGRGRSRWERGDRRPVPAPGGGGARQDRDVLRPCDDRRAHLPGGRQRRHRAWRHRRASHHDGADTSRGRDRGRRGQSGDRGRGAAVADQRRAGPRRRGQHRHLLRPAHDGRRHIHDRRLGHGNPVLRRRGPGDQGRAGELHTSRWTPRATW